MLSADSYLLPVDMDTSIKISIVLLALFIFGEALGEDLSVTLQSMEKRVAELEALTEKQRTAMDKLFSALMVEPDSSFKKKTGRNTNEADVDDIVASLSIEDLRSLLTGRDGANGMPGRDGRPGFQGLPGIAGPPGRDGRDGDDGDDRKDGDDGRPGLPGLAGRDGNPGNPGNSSRGLPGEPGSPGVAGPPGTVGLPGTPGSSGQRGIRGHPGTPANSSEIGSVYTRWGRTSCAGGSSLIYEGFAAGTYSSYTGGGTNFQCLPKSAPDHDTSFSVSSGVTYIHGVEYEAYLNSGSFGSSMCNQNAPCARCHSQRSSVMMYPAKRDCPTGWTKEYEGYLMTEAHTSTHPSTFECVDREPEAIYGMSGNYGGAGFYFIRPDCGGTGTIGHCGPYSSSYHLTCVVCTR